MHALTLLFLSPLFVLPSPSTDSVLPPPQRIEYRIHATRDDENSPIEWTITVDVAPIGRDGGTVMWSIVRAGFHEAATGWTWQHAPTPKIADWSIKHDDPLQPEAGEFAALPPIAGTAAPEGENGPPLLYSLSGREPTSILLPGFWWKLEYQGEPEPRSQGAGESMWVDNEDLPARVR
ncbi:MAG: hypothetical protein AMXMBFR47_36740 [Planctomycetota bacterium]